MVKLIYFLDSIALLMDFNSALLATNNHIVFVKLVCAADHATEFGKLLILKFLKLYLLSQSFGIV